MAGHLRLTKFSVEVAFSQQNENEVLALARQHVGTAYGRLVLCCSKVVHALARNVAKHLSQTGEMTRESKYEWLVEALVTLTQLCHDVTCMAQVNGSGLHRVLTTLASSGTDIEDINTHVHELLGVCGTTCARNGLPFPMLKVPMLPEKVDVRRLCVSSREIGTLEVLIRFAANTVETGNKANYDVGYRLWGACVALSRYLFVNRAELLRGRSVLEVGAGIGILGLLACHPLIQAKSVDITDFNLGIVKNIIYNVELNRAYWASVGDDKPVCSVYALDWDQEIKDSPSYDVILGSDLICQEDDAINVLRLVDKLLAPSGVAILTLGSPESRYGVAHFEQLLQRSVKFSTRKHRHESCEGYLETGEADPLFIGGATSYSTFEIRRCREA